jgi:HNH endonuclease
MITAEMRELVRVRCHFQCVYCGTHETEAGAVLTIDHIKPSSEGGTNTLNNFAYCCHACNQFKSDYWHVSPYKRLLNPLVDDMMLHITEEAITARLVGITSRGKLHITLLHLNRSPLLARRYRQQRDYFLELGESELLLRLQQMVHELTPTRMASQS